MSGKWFGWCERDAMRRAVFLDRDDTLIENGSLPWERVGAPRGDLCDPAWVRLLPGAAEGCRVLAGAGYALVVVTNQGLVARGVGTLEDVERTNRRMVELLREGGVPGLAGIYVCPYHPRGTVAPYNVEHEWRKPAPGMILSAARELDLDVSGSWMVGDSARDVEAGIASGIARERCLLVGPSREIPGLLEAARRIVGS